METNRKILIGTGAIFVFSVFVLGVFFTSWWASHSVVLLTFALLFLFLLLLIRLVKKRQKPLSKEEQAKRFRFGGIFFPIFGTSYLIVPFIVGDEIRLVHYVTAVCFIITGIGFLWQYFELQNENTN